MKANRYSAILFALLFGGGLSALSVSHAEEYEIPVEGGGEATALPEGEAPAAQTPSTTSGEAPPLGIPMGLDKLRLEKERSSLGNAPDSKNLGASTPKVLTKPRSGSEGGAAGGAELYPSSNCNTNTKTNFAPPDIHGAASSSRLVVVTNSDIGVYNASGCTAAVAQQSLKSFFATHFPNIPAAETLFDPRVIYDISAGRFLVTVESRNSGNTDQFQYFAVSTNSLGTSWFKYRIRLSEGANRFCKLALNSFWDYPQAGKSNKRWFIAANDFPAQGSARGAIISIDKTPTLTGAVPNAKCFDNLEFNTAPPVVLDTSTTSVFLAPNTATIAKRVLTEGATVGADTLSAATSYDIANWALPPDAAQPNGQKLDSLDGRFQSASIQSRDRIWNIHSVAFGNRSAIRWYRLQRSSTSVLSTVTFTSNGTSHLFNPSFVTNSGIDGSPAYITASRVEPVSTSCPASTTNSGCLAAMLTFSGPNSTSSGWTQGLAGTSTAQFATTGLNPNTSCNASPRGSCRWGDYSSITVDPSNAGRAWAFNQLINGTTMFDWSTRARMEIYNLQN